MLLFILYDKGMLGLKTKIVTYVTTPNFPIVKIH